MLVVQQGLHRLALLLYRNITLGRLTRHRGV